ncbi:MAG TPA: DUF2298 domain-containing protein [Thermoclostridium sp.]|nr:DUF2298 domain-containing protein [Thermoclostridium sp.]
MAKLLNFFKTLTKTIPYLLLPFTILLGSVVLKNEFFYVIKWWAVILLFGILFLPLSKSIFSTFTDKGFIFSKVIAIAISSYAFWFFSNLKLLKITTVNCWIVVIVCAVIIYIFFNRKTKKSDAIFNKDTLSWVFVSESIFLFSLSFWTYLRGFNPRLEGLEKFMDFGFVNSILRSGYVPPQDMWFSGEKINYYYFGQYVTAFLTSLSNLKTEISYNLMMATLFAFSMVLCFTIVTNMLKGHGINKKAPIITGGLIASILVSLGGNLHSFFYGLLPKLLQKENKYWFPDATRYIGYNPETNDKTIHEFPVYSFVVSDLHAHVVNMIFVLTIIGILLAVFRKLQSRDDNNWIPQNRIQELFIPEMLLIGLLIGIFQMSNYWDFPIYLTVCIFVFICAGIRQYGFSKKTWAYTVIRFAVVLISSLLFALPFNLSFEKMSSQIRIAKAHSLPHQLFILWGYQLIFAIIFFAVILIAEQNLKWKRVKGEKRLKIRKGMTVFTRIRTVLEEYSLEDIFAVILCISGIGLIFIPELVYVRDIYENGYARANTMFKLTYQAFIMLGLACGYIFIRIRKTPYKSGWMVVARIITVIMVILPMIYPFYAIPSWHNDMDYKKYQGIDGLAFLETEYPDDYELIYWLRDNIKGQPVVLEANGDSYTYNCRISMATGLPTVQGWFTHEWLWRDDLNLVQERIDDVMTIYESEDVELTKELIEQYDVEYIVIGKLEYKTFPNLNETKLIDLGTVVFEKPGVRLIKVE